MRFSFSRVLSRERGGAAGAGDRLVQLYKRFGPVIYSQCRRELKDDTAAEDATQKVFVRLLKQLEAAPDDAAALEKITRATARHCAEVLRVSRWRSARRARSDEPLKAKRAETP